MSTLRMLKNEDYWVPKVTKVTMDLAIHLNRYDYMAKLVKHWIICVKPITNLRRTKLC